MHSRFVAGGAYTSTTPPVRRTAGPYGSQSQASPGLVVPQHRSRATVMHTAAPGISQGGQVQQGHYTTSSQRLPSAQQHGYAGYAPVRGTASAHDPTPAPVAASKRLSSSHVTHTPIVDSPVSYKDSPGASSVRSAGSNSKYSPEALVHWLGSIYAENKLETLDDCKDAGAFLQLFAIIYPELIDMSKVRENLHNRRGILKNYALLKSVVQHADLDVDSDKYTHMLNGHAASIHEFLLVLYDAFGDLLEDSDGDFSHTSAGTPSFRRHGNISTDSPLSDATAGTPSSHSRYSIGRHNAPGSAASNGSGGARASPNAADSTTPPTIVPYSSYNATSSKFQASFRWLFRLCVDAYTQAAPGSPLHAAISPHVLDLKSALLWGSSADEGANRRNFKAERLLSSGIVYLLGCRIVVEESGDSADDQQIKVFAFHNIAQLSAEEAHERVLEQLWWRGHQPIDPGTNREVTAKALTSTRDFSQRLHVAVIDTLMAAYVEAAISIDAIVTHVKSIASFRQSHEYPFDLEHALLLWINKVCRIITEYCERHHPDRVESFRFLTISDLLTGLADGRALTCLLCYYAPRTLSITSIRTDDRQQLSLFAKAYNLALVRAACDTLEVDFPFHIEDLLYMDSSFLLNLICWLVQLFKSVHLSPMMSPATTPSGTRISREAWGALPSPHAGGEGVSGGKRQPLSINTHAGHGGNVLQSQRHRPEYDHVSDDDDGHDVNIGSDDGDDTAEYPYEHGQEHDDDDVVADRQGEARGVYGDDSQEADSSAIVGLSDPEDTDDFTAQADYFMMRHQQQQQGGIESDGASAPAVPVRSTTPPRDRHSKPRQQQMSPSPPRSKPAWEDSPDPDVAVSRQTPGAGPGRQDLHKSAPAVASRRPHTAQPRVSPQVAAAPESPGNGHDSEVLRDQVAQLEKEKDQLRRELEDQRHAIEMERLAVQRQRLDERRRVAQEVIMRVFGNKSPEKPAEDDIADAVAKDIAQDIAQKQQVKQSPVPARVAQEEEEKVDDSSLQDEPVPEQAQVVVEAKPEPVQPQPVVEQAPEPVPDSVPPVRKSKPAKQPEPEPEPAAEPVVPKKKKEPILRAKTPQRKGQPAPASTRTAESSAKAAAPVVAEGHPTASRSRSPTPPLVQEPVVDPVPARPTVAAKQPRKQAVPEPVVSTPDPTPATAPATVSPPPQEDEPAPAAGGDGEELISEPDMPRVRSKMPARLQQRLAGQSPSGASPSDRPRTSSARPSPSGSSVHATPTHAPGSAASSAPRSTASHHGRSVPPSSRTPMAANHDIQMTYDSPVVPSGNAESATVTPQSAQPPTSTPGATPGSAVQKAQSFTLLVDDDQPATQDAVIANKMRQKQLELERKREQFRREHKAKMQKEEVEKKKKAERKKLVMEKKKAKEEAEQQREKAEEDSKVKALKQKMAERERAAAEREAEKQAERARKQQEVEEKRQAAAARREELAREKEALREGGDRSTPGRGGKGHTPLRKTQSSTGLGSRSAAGAAASPDRRRGSLTTDDVEEPRTSRVRSKYSGPALRVNPTKLSNRKLIRNAITRCCLAGIVKDKDRAKTLEALDSQEGDNFVILLRAPYLNYRGLYVRRENEDVIDKVTGIGPSTIALEQIQHLLKYDSGHRAFSPIQSKTFTASTAGVTLHPPSNKKNHKYGPMIM